MNDLNLLSTLATDAVTALFAPLAVETDNDLTVYDTPDPDSDYSDPDDSWIYGTSC